MSDMKLRKAVRKYIDQADHGFLELVHEMSMTYEKTKIIGFDVEGKPINQKELVHRVKAASNRVKSGNFISGEEVEKEIENW